MRLYKLKHNLLTCVFAGMVFCPIPSSGQLDSLTQCLISAQHDSDKIRLHVQVALTHLKDHEFDESEDHAQMAVGLAQESGINRYRAKALNVLGDVFYYQSDYKRALEFFNEALDWDRQLGNQKGEAEKLTNIALTYSSLADNDTAIVIHEAALAINREINYPEGVAQNLGNIGNIHVDFGNYEVATDYFNKSLEIIQELEIPEYIASIQSNIGNIQYYQGKYQNAIEHYFEALSIYDQIGDDPGVARQYGNIGAVYQTQEDYEHSLEYFTKSLEINKGINNVYSMAFQLSNIGSSYYRQGNYDMAIEYFKRAEELNIEIDNFSGLATVYGNLGVLYSDKGDYQRAIEFYHLALEIDRKASNIDDVSRQLGNLGQVYYLMGNYGRSVEYYQEALEIAKGLDALDLIQRHYRELSKVYSELGNEKAAFEAYKKHIEIRDSIFSQKNRREIIRQEYKFKYEQRAIADSIRTAKAARLDSAKLAAARAKSDQQEAEADKRRQQTYFLFGGLILAISFGGFVYNRFRITRNQKSIIADQKKKVDIAYESLEEKNKEVLDSINYARRIQAAILPPENKIKDAFPESFILYKPKDIVAGDFYWMETLATPTPFSSAGASEGSPEADRSTARQFPPEVEHVEVEGDTGGNIHQWTYIAAADCTGHGVPGAMVSVVCSNALSKALIEEKITQPARILDRTRELVIDRFGRSEEEIKDGMDISLCALHWESGRLMWAGANNPLWIIRKDSLKIEEIKADKQPIGKYAGQSPYTNHEIQLEKGDTLYIFSDGFPDQFGGVKGKKYKSVNFKRLLISLQDNIMTEQRELISQEFEQWRGDIEQIDDICVIGLRY